MRDVLVKHNYKFPNISVFSTRTQATKDRRKVGFDELLKLLTIPGYAHSFTHSLTHSLTYLLTYSLTHSLTHLLTYSLTYSLTQLDNMFVKKLAYF